MHTKSVAFRWIILFFSLALLSSSASADWSSAENGLRPEMSRHIAYIVLFLNDWPYLQANPFLLGQYANPMEATPVKIRNPFVVSEAVNTSDCEDPSIEPLRIRNPYVASPTEDTADCVTSPVKPLRIKNPYVK